MARLTFFLTSVVLSVFARRVLATDYGASCILQGTTLNDNHYYSVACYQSDGQVILTTEDMNLCIANYGGRLAAANK